MRVLHLWNMTAGRCGIKNFGQMFSTAMRHAGCTVDDFDCTYPTLYQTGKYLPDNVDEYDVVHFNWHPITNNHYGAGHFAAVRGVRSIYLHDIPPFSGCPCIDAFQVRMTSEPSAISTLEVPYPIVDWVNPASLPPPNDHFTVGISGVRRDGFDVVAAVCEREGWTLNQSELGAWIALEDEIRRLARSTVNVCWYHEGRGLSGTPAMMLGARRPLLINQSPMLRHLHGIEGVLYRPGETLENMLAMVYEGQFGLWRELSHGIDPTLSWSTYAQHVIRAWEAA